MHLIEETIVRRSDRFTVNSATKSAINCIEPTVPILFHLKNKRKALDFSPNGNLDLDTIENRVEVVLDVSYGDTSGHYQWTCTSLALKPAVQGRPSEHLHRKTRSADPPNEINLLKRWKIDVKSVTTGFP